MNKKKTKKLLIKYGIADAYGVECYHDSSNGEAPSSVVLFFRAEANRQRHAVMFVISISKENDEVVQKLLKDRKFDKALLAIKKFATEVDFPTSRKKFYKNSWKIIPNPKLDPWNN